MEIHNGNYEEILIRQHKVLKYNDKIIFRINNRDLLYSVSCDHCSCMNGANDQIFRELGLDPATVCKQNYGYFPTSPGSVWPTSKYEDYEALTRIVVSLFKLIAPHVESHETIRVSIPQNQTIKIIL